VVTFHRDFAEAPPARLPRLGSVFASRHVTVARPVAEHGQRLGAVYLETLPEPWPAILARHSALGLLTILSFLLLAW